MIPYVDAVICDGLWGECWAVERECAAEGKAFVLFTANEELWADAQAREIPAVMKPAGVTELLGALRLEVCA